MTRIFVLDMQNTGDELCKIIGALGFDVCVSKAGNKGFNSVNDHLPHIIVINSTILGEPEWEICKQIRELDKTPILILSADADPAKTIAALTYGADVVLSKPVSNRILLAHLETLSRRARAELTASNQDTTFQPLVD